MEKFSKASVALSNGAEDLAPEDFKTLNRVIKDNFPKNKTEGNYPTSCGKSINRRGYGSCRKAFNKNPHHDYGEGFILPF